MDVQIKLTYETTEGHCVSVTAPVLEELIECLTADEIIEFLGYDVESTFYLQVVE
jgi:hypothetical protein